MTDKLRKKLHNIALKHGVSDTLAKIIVDSPFQFQKRKLEENADLHEKPISFYHKYLGNIYLREDVLNKIKKIKSTKNEQN